MGILLLIIAVVLFIIADIIIKGNVFQQTAAFRSKGIAIVIIDIMNDVVVNFNIIGMFIPGVYVYPQAIHVMDMIIVNLAIV